MVPGKPHLAVFSRAPSPAGACYKAPSGTCLKTAIRCGLQRGSDSLTDAVIKVSDPLRSDTSPMLKRIPVTELRAGMFVHELCGSWMDHPFWRSAFKLKDAKDIRRIRESGVREVWIDTAKGRDVARPEPTDPAAPPVVAADPPEAQAALPEPVAEQDPPARVESRAELVRAARICATARAAVTSMFQEARMGQAVDAEATAPLVAEIASSVMRNPGALISLARLKTKDDYTYMHSVAVCALMVALGRELDLDEAMIHQVGTAGLLHDIGKMAVPLEILNKPGKLTDSEFVSIRAHPEAGWQMLQEGRGVSEVALEVCLHHHEKVDGSGYPHRLAGDAISLVAKMGAVCDVYDAITSDRPYKTGWQPTESLRKMTEWANGHFDPTIFRAFVKAVGIYPLGSLVRLQSGRLGVVVAQTGKSLLTPQVKVFFSTRSDAHIQPEIVDLDRPGCADRIVEHEDPTRWGFRDLSAMWAAPE